MPEAAIKLSVKVVPGSSRDQIAGWMEDALRIKVVAQPEKGKANQAVEKLLAKSLKLSGKQVKVVSGKVSSHKIVEISGISLAVLKKTLV